MQRYLPEETPIDALIAELVKRTGIKHTTVLGAFVGLSSPTVCRIRQGRVLSAELILRIHDFTGMSVEEIRKISKTPPILTRFNRSNHNG